jgi:glucose/arabinose dehydrogenase
MRPTDRPIDPHDPGARGADGDALSCRRAISAAYRDDAYVAMDGSWNRDDPAGYKVVRIRFDRSNGEPRGFEDFVTGFIDEREAVAYGRPVGIAFAGDGAMLVTDDLNGAIYRISYVGARR